MLSYVLVLAFVLPIYKLVNFRLTAGIKQQKPKEILEMKKLEVLRRIWGIYAPFKSGLAGVFAMSMIQQGINASFPILVGLLTTSVFKMDTEMFYYTLCGWVALGCVRIVAAYMVDRIDITKLDQKIASHLSRISMEKFFNISMGQHHIGHSIIKRTVIGKGETGIRQLWEMSMYNLIPIALMIIVPTVFLLVKVPLVGLWALCSMLCFMFFTLKYNVRFAPLLRSLDTSSNMISKKHGEIIANAEVIYVNAQEPRVKREHDAENMEQVDVAESIWISYIKWFFTGQWFVMMFRASSIGLAGYLIFKHKLSGALFVTVYMWIESSLGSLGNISGLQRTVTKLWPQIEKYFRFLDYEPDIVVPAKPVPMAHLRGRIEMRNVSFTYTTRASDEKFDGEEDKDEDDGGPERQELPAVRDVSLVIEDGKRYAFVGRSGAGKSTMVGLILRAHDPQEGHILVDGVDIRMLDYRELRRRTGYVPQEVSLFDGTLRYNVTFGLDGGEKSVTVETLNRVAKLSRVSEFFDKLEKGWDTIIGERGIKLSGGQRQRVGIARALIKDPQILIFDEATSHLDTENEAWIRESIREASVGKTTIIVAHRLATVKDVDKIFVFDEGRIVGEGSHDFLLETNESYKRLVSNQVIMA